MTIEANKIIWLPSEAYPDINRQIIKNKKKPSSLRVVTVPKKLYKQFGINQDTAEFISLGNYWIDISKLKSHLLKVKQNIPASVFYGKIDKKVYSSALFDKYKDKNKIFGDLTVGLRAEYRTEKVINFGKKTGMRHLNNASVEELDFENFIFLGFFGGGFPIENKKKNLNLNFVELVIDRETKEIFHRINYEKLEEFKIKLNLQSDLEIFPDILEVDDIDKIDLLYNQWDNNIDKAILLEDYGDQKVIFARQANLSFKHTEIKNVLAHYFIEKGYMVKREKYGFIDLYIENEIEIIIFEIKTSRFEIYKAIGQILTYENFIKSIKNYKQNIKKIILNDKKYEYSKKILLTLNKYNIELKELAYYIN